MKIEQPLLKELLDVANMEYENDKWITLKPHGDDSDDYRRLKIEDGETVEEAMDRKFGIRQSKGQQHLLKKSEYKIKKEDKKEDKSKKEPTNIAKYSVTKSGWVWKTFGSGYDAFGNPLAKTEFLSKEEYEKETGKSYEDLVKKDKEETKKWLEQQQKQQEPAKEAPQKSAYEERKEARIARLEELASKNRSLANQAHRDFDARMSIIPAGQPIHGQRDRNYREKAWNKLGQAVQLSDKAKYYEEKARAAASNNMISSDDPEAITKLHAKIDKLTLLQNKMKEANKVAKSKKLSDEEKIQKLQEMNYSESNARELLKPDFAGRIGFPDYTLTNNNANIRRLKQRVTSLERTREMVSKQQPTEDYSKFGFNVERNQDLNRLQLHFDGIPTAETRSILKHSGFRWSPYNKAWQRQLNANSEYALKSVVKQLDK